MIVEVVITEPTQEIAVRPVKYLDEYIVPSAADRELIEKGSINITMMSGREDHHAEIVVATVDNLRLVNGAVIGDLTINGELRHYLDGNVLRFEIGAFYMPPARAVFTPDYPKAVGRFTTLHLVTPLYERVVAPKQTNDVPLTDAKMHILKLTSELAALSVLGVAISDVYYEGQVITKLRFSNGTEIDVPRPLNINW